MNVAVLEDRLARMFYWALQDICEDLGLPTRSTREVLTQSIVQLHADPVCACSVAMAVHKVEDRGGVDPRKRRHSTTTVRDLMQAFDAVANVRARKGSFGTVTHPIVMDPTQSPECCRLTTASIGTSVHNRPVVTNESPMMIRYTSAPKPTIQPSGKPPKPPKAAMLKRQRTHDDDGLDLVKMLAPTVTTTSAAHEIFIT